jgi:hypothetical protein
MALCQIDVMPTSCFPECQRETIGFTRPMPTTIDPEAPFQTNPPVPIESPQVSHQRRICKTSGGQTDHPALVWQQ